MKTKEKPKVKIKEKEKTQKSEAKTTIDNASFVLRSISPTGAQGRLQNVRLAFVKVKEPQVDRANPLKASYSVTALIPNADFKAVCNQVLDAIKQHVPMSKKIIDRQERINAFNEAKNTGEKKSLFKIGDEVTDKSGKPYDGFSGHHTIQIKTTVTRDSTSEDFPAPKSLHLMDKRGSNVPQQLADKDFYSGCFAHVACTFATYDFRGSKGITCFLNGLMKVADADRLGASNPFADVEPIDTSSAAAYGGSDDEDMF